MTAEKVILHSDVNAFYASVEEIYRPELRKVPVAVCGDPELRHGIVLTKNQLAKKTGVLTGQAIWEAKQLCPDLVVIMPNYKLYMEYARMVQEIYCNYTDQVEPYGMDECFLDVTGSVGLFGNGEKIANEIRTKISRELGITVSIGVSYNKTFAKLGSDMKKPDAVTVITEDNYKHKVWPLPAVDLLFVGRATALKLYRRYNIATIGELANFDVNTLHALLGKPGVILHRYANGLDFSEVRKIGEEPPLKSIGNSTTTPRDLRSTQDVYLTMTLLAESVAARLRENGLKATTVQISMRTNDMLFVERQAKLKKPSYISSEIANLAMEIFKNKYKFTSPIRTLGVRGCNLVPENQPFQLSLFDNVEKQKKMENLERMVDGIRSKHGFHAVKKATMLLDRELTNENPKDEHVNPCNPFLEK